MSSCHVTSKRFQELLEAFLKYKNVIFNGEQEKEFIIPVRMRYKNMYLVITVCHHSASLVMPNGDPRDRFFYTTLTIMIDSYTKVQANDT